MGNLGAPSSPVVELSAAYMKLWAEPQHLNENKQKGEQAEGIENKTKAPQVKQNESAH